MKKKLLSVANALLSPFGAQIYRKGFDMESVLRRLGVTAPEICTIVDLGAARGVWSRMALDLFPNAQVIGVDPLREREPYLKRLKDGNSRYDYVLAVAGAEDGGTVELAVTGDLDGSTVHGSDGEKRQVPVHSVDAMLKRKGLKGPYFLKFDTHGFEKPILDGAVATLAHTHYVVMETYNFRHTPETLLFHEMIALMEGKGFRVFNLVEPMQRPTDDALWQVDLFFARADNPVFASSQFRG
jgi:FkbM family methyltransferase